MTEETFRKRPEGPVAVALFSVSAGVFAMGVASLINQALNPSQWVPVPGVTSVQELEGGRKMILMWSNFAQMTALFFVLFIVWMVTWMVLHESFARRRRASRRWYAASVALLAVGLLLSFPPFYQRVFPQPVTGPFRLNQPFTSDIERPARPLPATQPPEAGREQVAVLPAAVADLFRASSSRGGWASEEAPRCPT